MNDMHSRCNINKLDDRRTSHLLNFVNSRSRYEEYAQKSVRNLRRYNTPLLTEIRSNHTSFEKIL